MREGALGQARTTCGSSPTRLKEDFSFNGGVTIGCAPMWVASLFAGEVSRLGYTIAVSGGTCRGDLHHDEGRVDPQPHRGIRV